MFGKRRTSRWLIAAAVLAVTEVVGLAALTLAVTTPAQAQWFGQSDSYQRRPRPQPRSNGGFFGGLFGPFEQRPYQGGGDEQQQHVPSHQGESAGSARAPAPKKADKDAPPPTTSIVVMGDAMADWLAYGLEDAFADAPEIGILRKNRTNSGLIRYDAKGDLDWWHVAKDLLAPEKPNYVVMMLGINDRQNIRERDLAKEAEKKAEADKKAEAEKKAKEAEKKEADKKDGDKKPADATPSDAKPPADQDAAKNEGEDDGIVAPEPPRGRRANGIIEFRTEQWATIYSRRIDETIAALKSKGVPVFWVGLPALRGPKSTADMVYLNDLYRARAEKAGAVYIDVWDGFVDESGKFATFGPDYEGQNRRLRTADGVFFTKYGARKLAHYVEREIRRYMANRGPIALPSGPMVPMPSDGKPAARPLAGPVMPLTTTPANADALLGGGGGGAVGDQVATQVLVKGEPLYAPYGRADDFVWPRSESNRPPPPAPVAVAPAAASANASAAVAPVPAPIVNPEPVAVPKVTEPRAEPKSEARTEPAERPAQTARPKRVEPQRLEPRADLRPSSNAPRPPAPVRQPSRGPFDWFR